MSYESDYCIDTVLKLLVQFWKKIIPTPRKVSGNSKRVWGEEGFKNNSKELSWSVGKGVSMGDMGDFQFYTAKTSNCEKISKFDWILLMTKIKNYLPLRS